ncbi:MAG: ATP-binding protein [Dethiobacteria bacterium]|nr:cell wall metabolism sensor histidine kinase WalK [Bacillota bacterium]HOP68277.1 ATP-binding protein [Bacillota bacterium]HPT33147.1 ATP-binding protein [Bacillota bacterium]HPZ65440.1 ATP-binding protein [Bacillota bacterium]HQD05594.1 ATP-binding protein [Bacillota bacterium]
MNFKFRSIRARITVTFAAIILVVMALITLYLSNFLERYFLNSRQQDYINSINDFLAVELVAAHLSQQQDQIRLSSLAENLSRQTGARVIIVDREKKVVGDSVRVGGLLGQALAREEVDAALAGGVETSIQYSTRLEQRVMQVAVPVPEKSGETVGVVFLSASLEEVYTVLGDLRRILMIATLLAIAVAMAGSFFLARRLTGPLELLAEASREMAEGNLNQQINVGTRDEIGHLAQQFNHMASRLNYYTRNLQNFAANVSHELRTPLASMSLMIKSMRQYEMEPEQQQEFLKDVDQELDRMTNLVQDLLELTKLERGEMEKERFSLTGLLHEIVHQLSPRFQRQDIRLISHLPPEEVEVEGSPLQLRQVFHNLLDNALKYTSPGGWVRISVWLEEKLVGIKIEDTGVGIPEKDLPHIFERFYRVDLARSREMGGTGLGLAIAREIVVAHGGRIWAESEEQKGSRFYVTLPRPQGTNIKDN